MPDPYLLTDEVLLNIPGITYPEKLEIEEDKSTLFRLAQIHYGEGPAITGDCLKDLKAFHKFIFQDIYPWAGTTRAEPFVNGKGRARRTIETNFTSQKGRKVFARPKTIAERLAASSMTLQAANGFRGLKRHAFVVGIADLLADINEIHAFREGNGRAQRAYVDQIAKLAGRTIDFRVITEERMVHASVAVDQGDSWPMRRLIRDAASPERVKEMLKLKAFLTKNHETTLVDGKKDPDLDPNKRYIGFVEPGHSHTAKMIGVSGRHFACVEGKSKILIGWRKDLPDGQYRSDDVVTFVGRGAPTNRAIRNRSSIER